MSDIHELIIYNKSLELIKTTYDLIKNNNKLRNDFSLCDQIKRAAISVACNISEGYYRTRKQSKNYLNISSGSTNEVVTLLEIIELTYQITTKELREKYIYLGKQINTFSSRF
jgi:four helix bundle protein